jgi:hypothetical protein
MERLDQARAEVLEHRPHPWRKRIEEALGGADTIGSAALLDMIDQRPTTGNARRLASVMRSLGYIPIKSRRLMPGGFRDTTTRGWTRAVREEKDAVR